MDPETVLARIVKFATLDGRVISPEEDSDAWRAFREDVAVLHAWMVAGGFTPKQWRTGARR